MAHAVLDGDITGSLSKLNTPSQTEVKMRMNVRMVLLGIPTASIYLQSPLALRESLPLVTCGAAACRTLLNVCSRRKVDRFAGDWTNGASSRAWFESDESMAVEKMQKLLDPLCLVGVLINPESQVRRASRTRVKGTY